MYNPAESHINVIMQLVRELFELRRIEQFTPSEFRQNCIRQFTRRSFFFFFPAPPREQQRFSVDILNRKFSRRSIKGR